MFGFITGARIIRADLDPRRSIFLIYDLLGLVMAWSAWAGWQDLAPFREHRPIATVSLTEVALLRFCGFYGLRLAMFVALARRLRMPQPIEWLVAIVPASVTIVCFVLGGPIERAYAASQGYTYCGRSEDAGTRSSRYVFARSATPCPKAAGTAKS